MIGQALSHYLNLNKDAMSAVRPDKRALFGRRVVIKPLGIRPVKQRHRIKLLF
jgi:hypothetical protein